jgi:hypothetical protein
MSSLSLDDNSQLFRMKFKVEFVPHVPIPLVLLELSLLQSKLQINSLLRSWK